jgi:predicted RNA-binding Zn ribbon-like protein
VASELVDGCTIPLRLADDVALDFCNTRAGWGDPEPKEYLRDFRTLLVWAREAALVTPAEFGNLEQASQAARTHALARAIELREAVYQVLDPRRDQPPAADLESLRRALLAAVKGSEYGRVADDRWQLNGGTEPELVVHRLAIAADDLLRLRGRSAVGRCAGRGCGWLFLNQGGRRRWCIMAICGNRAKARRRAERESV